MDDARFVERVRGEGDLAHELHDVHDMPTPAQGDRRRRGGEQGGSRRRRGGPGGPRFTGTELSFPATSLLARGGERPPPASRVDLRGTAAGELLADSRELG